MKKSDILFLFVGSVLPCFLAHLAFRPGELLSSLFVRRLSSVRQHWLSDTILKGTHRGTIPARFGLIWFSSFRGEDLNVIFYQNMPNLHNRYISQNVPKFELCKHNELFSIYYRIFYELWTFADFDRLCKLENRGDEIISAERKISQKNPEYRLNYFLPCSCS
jgi:hypothetical protein